MSDPIKELSESGWIAVHRKLYLEDGVAGHMWDSTVGGGPGRPRRCCSSRRGAVGAGEHHAPLRCHEVSVVEVGS